MIRIGVLALQGSKIEHTNMLECLPDTATVAVKTKDDILNIDGIILPGGESSTTGKLLKSFDLFDTLKKSIQEGLPVWGTCAGMILLAKRVIDDTTHLGVMDITVRRNAYGSQLDSFKKQAVIPKIGIRPIDLVFIRAPWIEQARPPAEVVCSLDGHIVAAQQGNMLATSFHPELTTDLSVHKYFLSMVKKCVCIKEHA